MSVPYWCLFADHKPYELESDYTTHMLEKHGVNLRTGQRLENAPRPWQCADSTHPIFESEMHFLAHMASAHSFVITE